MIKRVYFPLDFNIIQNIRIIHAISESSYVIVIDKDDEPKFKELKRLFNIKYELKNLKKDFVTINNYEILHNKPLSKIGEIDKFLLFPHAITNHCKKIWKNEREMVCSFAGLITESRKIILNKYLEKNYGKTLSTEISVNSKYRKFLLKIKNILKLIPSINQKRIGDIVFWSSARGRTFPIKSWDEEDFKLLSNSKFVPCPNGDFIWTYRFFEAILCGAIPIIKDYCDLYEGFKYKTFNDSLDNLQWNEEDAEFNFELCVRKLTISKESLDSEILSLFNMAR